MAQLPVPQNPTSRMAAYGVGGGKQQPRRIFSNTTLPKSNLKIQQIDKENRLWGQPYFALNPNEGTQKELK